MSIKIKENELKYHDEGPNKLDRILFTTNLLIVNMFKELNNGLTKGNILGTHLTLQNCRISTHQITFLKYRLRCQMEPLKMFATLPMFWQYKCEQGIDQGLGVQG